MAVIYGEGQLFFDIRKKSFCEQLNALDANARQKVLEEYADWKGLSNEDKQYFLNAEIRVKTELLLNEDDIEEDKEIIVDINVSSEFDDTSRYFYFTEDDRTDEEIEELRREQEKAIEEYERREKEARVDELTYGRDDDY